MGSRTLTLVGGSAWNGTLAPTGEVTMAVPPAPRDDLAVLTPNVIAVKHWNRRLGGLL